MNNQFSVVKGCSKYIVFRCGRVFNRKSKRFLSGMKLSGKYNSGYVVYAFHADDGTVRNISLRHLLAESFIEEYVPGCEIHVIDKHKPICADNIEISKDIYGNTIRTRCRVHCMESGKSYSSLSELSRELCGDSHLKGMLSSYIHCGRPYRGNHYILLP